jgi:hypothetical protein
MLAIINAVNQNELVTHASMLKELGIDPIWVKKHEQVPTILDFRTLLPGRKNAVDCPNYTSGSITPFRRFNPSRPKFTTRRSPSGGL